MRTRKGTALVWGRGGLKGGGLPMSGCKKGWESRGLRTNAYFISISICNRYITLDISFFFNDN